MTETSTTTNAPATRRCDNTSSSCERTATVKQGWATAKAGKFVTYRCWQHAFPHHWNQFNVVRSAGFPASAVTR